MPQQTVSPFLVLPRRVLAPPTFEDFKELEQLDRQHPVLDRGIRMRALEWVRLESVKRAYAHVEKVNDMPYPEHLQVARACNHHWLIGRGPFPENTIALCSHWPCYEQVFGGYMLGSE